MTTTAYTDGSVTVTLDEGLSAFVRSMLDASQAETVRLLEAEGEAVAAEARRDWYGADGVTWRTGRSGDIQSVTVFDAAKDEVRVRVGSTDTRTAGKSGKPIPAFVHRPTATSRIRRPAKAADFASGKAVHSPPGKKVKGAGYVEESNPKASDGRYLMPELIGKPIKVRLKAISARLGDLIAKRAQKGA